MSEGRVVLMAVIAAVAAVVGASVPVPIGPAILGGAACVVMAAHRRRSASLLVAVALLGLGRGAQADDAYVAVAPGRYVGDVTLVTDPEPTRFGTQAEVALDDGRRVMASVGVDLGRFETLGAGNTVAVVGRLRPIDPSPWARSRHLLGRLAIGELGAVDPVAWWRVPSEWCRSAVAGGARFVPERLQPLYLGLVIGDDRGQGAAQQARFRVAGLSHLLAVSGQNVAFVLAVAAPLIRRLGWWNRTIAALVVLAGFAIATRLEPSVLRASATAAVSVAAVATGGRAAGARALAIATTALVLVDPLLVWSIGFRLSIAASAAIVVLGPALDRRLPGAARPGRPARWWHEPLTVTTAAQIGVAPLLVTMFGPVALVSIPANVLAGGAAGLTMTWGLTVGVVAGLVGGPAAAVMQAPVALAVWWIDAVALVATRVPSPVVGAASSLPAFGLVVAGWVLDRSRGEPERVGRASITPWRLLGMSAGGIVLVVTMPRAPEQRVDLAGGATYWPGRDGTALLVVSAGADDRLVESLVESRIHRIDVVVLESGGRTMSLLMVEVARAVDVGVALAPPMHRVVGARRVEDPVEVAVGPGRVLVTPESDDRLRVEFGHRPERDP